MQHLIPSGGAAAGASALLHAAQAAPLQLSHAPRLLPQLRHLLLERLYGLLAQDRLAACTGAPKAEGLSMK